MFGLLDYIMSLIPRDTPNSTMPLHGVKEWNPFRIDALGLVTLLGAEEVNKNVGTLQRRRFTEFLPLLAAFIVAGNRFVEEQPGYSIYNISDGIHTSELKGWFTRWLSSQRIQNGTSIIRWRVHSLEDQPFAHAREKQLIAPIISAVAVLPLLVFTTLIGDWFGIGNSVAIIASIIVRKVLLWQLRNAINRVATAEDDKPAQPSQTLPLHHTDSEKPLSPTDSFKQLHRKHSTPLASDEVKMFVTRADGKMVTMYAPRSLLSTFTRESPVADPATYHLFRWFGWAAFGAHIVVLGMSTLFTQIYTVILLVVSTWIMCHDFVQDSGRHIEFRATVDGTQSKFVTTAFTSRIVAEQEDPFPRNPKMDKRMHAYVRAQPTERQENMLKHWSMLPFDGVVWYDTYEQAKVKYQEEVRRHSPSLMGSSAGSKSPLTESVRTSGSATPGASP